MTYPKDGSSSLFDSGAAEVTADSRSRLKAWLAGMKAADGIAMMFGVHGGEEVGGGFVVGFVL